MRWCSSTMSSGVLGVLVMGGDVVISGISGGEGGEFWELKTSCPAAKN